MLDIKNLNLSDETVQKIVTFFREMWFGMPKWLRHLLVLALIIGGSYFLYNRVIMSYNMDSLESELNELNTRCKSYVVYDRYAYDVDKVVISIKAVENATDVMYKEHVETLHYLMEYIRSKNPNDPVLEKIDDALNRSKFAKETYDKVILHNIDLYEHYDPLREEQEKNSVKTDDDGDNQQ